MENRAIINEIYRTIMKAGIIPLSWGINTFKATWYRGMPTLKFHGIKVRKFLFETLKEL